MSMDSVAGKLVTPQRIAPMQVFSGLFRTPTRLHTPTTVNRRNKRTRTRASSLSSPTSSTPDTPSSLPAVVLQTYSVSTDSIVLTALSSAPFCCHEDLLTMSRAQLEGVVRTLNARLPRRMRICPEDDFWQYDLQDNVGDTGDDDDDGLSRMSEAEMKRRIEELVGIRAIVGKNRVSRMGLGLDTRARVPPAPKALRTRDASWRPLKTPWEMEVDDAQDQGGDLGSMIDDTLMGSSPLAGRAKSSALLRGRDGAMSWLPVLEEENEGSELRDDDAEDEEERPFKRQRMLPRSPAQYSPGFQIIKEAMESRLIENLDVSGSPLLAGEEDASLDDSAEKVVETLRNPDPSVKVSEGGVQTFSLHRRSARIKEIALKRASLLGAEKKTTLDAKGLKTSILRSKGLSSPRNSSSPDGTKGSNTPRELAVRLPFACTTHQKPEGSIWSAPILRSHSHRLRNLKRTSETKTSLGRSQSERYPRTSDLAYVTIDRPRYRFAQRKLNGVKATNGDQEHRLSMPAHTTWQPQRGFEDDTEYANEKPDNEKENKDSDEGSKGSMLGGLIGSGTLSSALCGFLSPRYRALSTSTVTSTLSHCDNSPTRAIATAGTTSAATATNDGTTERVWQALGRMAVDSL